MDRAKVTANGVDFAYLTAGPGDGPLALCLHGFPDTAHTWRHLLPRLADAGFRAVAPFLRGYAPTSVPADGRYDTGTLALDACALHQALGGDGEAVIIGHDWGAFATYGAAAIQPDRWRKVVTAAVAPQASMADGFFTYDQLRRSWYVFFFQTQLAEHAVSLDDHAFIDRLWADWSPGFDGSWDAARVKEALATPENLGAAIGYYRAMFSGPPDDPEAAAAQTAAGTVAPQPTLYLHGADDGCMGIDTIGPVTDFLAPGSEMAVIDGAGHFLHVERPDEVNGHILRFLSS
jgi:pimeloyl-ACP methyl ester carboxylesterase